MQLGLSTYSFPWAIGVNDSTPPTPLTASGLLTFAAQNGIKAVQIGDNLPLHSFTKEELQQLRNMAESLGIDIEVGTKGLNKENIEQYVLIAELLQSAFIRVVIDDAAFRPTEDQVIENIKAVLPQLKETGILLGIENHDRFPATTLVRIIQKTDASLVGICLDTANSLGANEGINEVMDVLAAYTINLHIKDITISRLPHKMGFIVEGCVAGTGLLDIPFIINTVTKFGRCKTVTLEVWSQPEATIEETILKEKQWVKKSITYLKNILK